MPKKKPAPKRRASTSTALARRSPSKPKPIQTPAIVAPVPSVERAGLTDQISLGELGLLEIKLTEEEERILNEPVPVDEIRIKPTGAAYLSHPTYTRWFNRAFGRLGWAIVPASKPMTSGKAVVQPYVLHIHGKPAVYAIGEHDYHENNAEQTYGDALESTVASALRRCAKRLGVGLEMWDPDFLNEWIRRECIKVWLKGKQDGDAKKPAWRRRTDPPFWNEDTAGRGSFRAADEFSQAKQAERRPPPPVPADSGSHLSNDPITDKQVSRLWAIIRNAGRSENEVRDYLLARFNIDTTKAIKRRDYETICTAIEHPGPLLVTFREPGEEG